MYIRLSDMTWETEKQSVFMYTFHTGRCISQNLLCNGDWDCELGSDEENCEETHSPETKCVNMISIPGAEKATQG